MNKQVMYKIIISIFLSLLLITSFTAGISANQGDGSKHGEVDYTGEVENDRFLLNCDKATGNIRLFDKLTEQEYYGVPENAEKDPVAKGIYKMALNSQIVIHAVKIMTNQIADIMSYSSCVKKNSVDVQQLSNGFRVIYNFKTEMLSVPVYFLIEKDVFQVIIKTNEIIEGEKYYINEIEVLPYFASGSIQDNGYIMVPDGSGALIEFNNKKAILGDYIETIYGRDETFYLKQKSKTTETVRMPVFGIEKNGYGFLAVADESDAAGKIMAGVSGIKSTYNYACFRFTLHSTDTVYINKDTWYEKGVMKYNHEYEINKINISYHFYTEKYGGYFKMAEIYRELLKQKEQDYKKSNDDNTLLIDILSSIDVKKSILGVPVNLIESMSTFKETGLIIDEIKDCFDGDLVVNLVNTTAQIVKEKRKTGFSPLLKLGGKKELKKLLKRDDVNFYLDIDIMTFDAGPFNFLALFNGCKSLSNETSIKYTYDVADFSIDKDARYLGLSRPSDYKKIYTKVLKDLKSFSFSGISPGAFGSMLYSNFDKKKFTSRQSALKLVEETYKMFSEEKSVMTTKPNAYSVPYSDILADIPDESSRYDIFDYDIPFVSLVFNGYKDFSFVSSNMKADQKSIEMKILETGAIPKYTFFYEESNRVKDTRFTNYYSCNYRDWLENIEKVFSEKAKFNELTNGSSISSHQVLKNNVYKVIYENGAEFIFNYSNEQFVIDGNTIAPVSYKMLERGLKQ